MKKPKGTDHKTRLCYKKLQLQINIIEPLNCAKYLGVYLEQKITARIEAHSQKRSVKSKLFTQREFSGKRRLLNTLVITDLHYPPVI